MNDECHSPYSQSHLTHRMGMYIVGDSAVKKNTVVVIIDVFQATSTIASALINGAKCVIPVDLVPGQFKSV